MRKAVDILGKGTKFKLFSIINKVLLYLAPVLLFGVIPERLARQC